MFDAKYRKYSQKDRTRRSYGCLFYKVSPTPELQFLRLRFRIARHSLLKCRSQLGNTRMYLLLHLRILLDLESSPTQLPSLTICPIDYQSRPIIKYTSGYAILLPQYVGCWLIYFMVDLAGFEPAS